jgi:hypothetical protein
MGTNFNTDTFLGIKYIFSPIVRTFIKRFPNSKVTPIVANIYNSLSSGDSMYPDTLSIVTFWILLLIIIPWTVTIIIKKGKFYSKLYALALIILLSFFVILGPYIKIGGASYNFPLPHIFLHTIFYPLQAIRAVWRGAFIGYLAVIIFWAIISSKIWTKYFNVQNTFNKIYIIFISLVLVPVMLVIQNGGFIAPAMAAYKPDREFNRLIDEALSSDNNKNSDLYVWRRAAPQAEAMVDFYHYNISERNNKLGYKQISWVSGGIAGLSPLEMNYMDISHSRQLHIEESVSVLEKKQIDLIIQEKALPEKKELNKDYYEKSQNLLSKYWKITGEGEKYIMWKKIDKKDIIENKKLSYSLSLSGTQSESSINNFVLNISNPSEEVWVNKEVVKSVNFKIAVYKGDENKEVISAVNNFGEPVFIGPRQGYPMYFSNKNKLFEKGGDTIKLFRNGEEVFSKKIKILSSQEYSKLIEKNKKDELKLDDSRSKYLVDDYGLNTISLNIISKVESGTMLANKEYSDGITVKYLFRSKDKLEDPYVSYSMPPHVGQPNCSIGENFLPGDEINLWCIQHVPQLNPVEFASFSFKISLQNQKRIPKYLAK